MTVIRTPRLAIHARIEGQGPPLLFLGGSSTDISLNTPVFDSPLSAAFRIATADPRGLGLTEQPGGDWTMEDYARDALGLLDALDWERVDVLGESFGGMTALHLAGLAPDRVRRLALSVAAPGGPGGRSYPVEEIFALSDPRARAERSLQVQDRRFAAVPEPERAARIDARVAQEATFLGHAENANGYPRLLAARAGHDARAHLGQIEGPTLVLSGLHDDQSPLALSERLVAALPRARLSRHDAGHGLLFTDPTALAAVLAHFKETTP